MSCLATLHRSMHVPLLCSALPTLLRLSKSLTMGKRIFYLFYGFIPSPGKCYLIRFFLQSWGVIGEGSVHNPLRCFLAVSWAFLYAGVLSYWM